MRMFDSRQTLFVVLTTALLFSYPFYASNLLPMRLTLGFCILGFVLVCLTWLRAGRFDPKSAGWLALWAIAALYVALNCVLSGYHYEFARVFYPWVLIASLLCMLVVSRDSAWVSVALKTIVVMLVPFALATIFFYFFPAVYPPVKGLLFPESVFATGYKSGLTAHYSYNGTYCVVGFLLAAGLAFYDRKESSAFQRKSWVVIAVVFLIALLLIGKRQNLLFGFVAVLVVYLLSNDTHKYAKAFVALAIGSLCVLLAMQFVPGIEASFSRLFETFGNEDLGEATSSRDVLWESAYAGWMQSPLFGNGWSSFSYDYSEVNTVHVAHNEFLDLLYGSGIVGMLLFFGCVVLSLGYTICAFRKACFDASGRYAKWVAPLAAALMLQLYDVLMAFTIGSLFATPSAFMPYLFAVAVALAFHRSTACPRPQETNGAADL